MSVLKMKDENDPSFAQQLHELNALTREKSDVPIIVNILSPALLIHCISEKHGVGETNNAGNHNDYDVDGEDECDCIFRCLMSRSHKHNSPGAIEWVLDSECSHHMNEDKYRFQELHKNDRSRRNFTFGDNSEGKVYGLGKVIISRHNSIKISCLLNHLVTIFFPLQN